jgi:methylated-DNA-[protein]-cysteine S-methyltransferase
MSTLLHVVPITDPVAEAASFGYESPIGRLAVSINAAGAITAIDFDFASASLMSGPQSQQQCAVARWLDGYFAGEQAELPDVSLVAGTAFQRQVWKALLEIPYGQTRSYRWLAERVGLPKAIRAVGQANRRNPVPIVVPCHRVIASDGTLGGYMGATRGHGLAIKAYLLALEQGERPEPVGPVIAE